MRNVKMKITPHSRRYETIDGKSRRRKLPVSPDITVYQPQLTSILSISNRLSGLALATYTTSFGLNALFGHHEFSDLITMIEGLELSAPILVALKFVFVYPFTFHTCCGIRHLLWDTGNFLTIKGVYATGYVAVCSSLVLSAILASL